MTDKKLEDAFGRVRAFLWMLARGNGIVEVSSDLSREILGFYLTVEADAARQSQTREQVVRKSLGLSLDREIAIEKELSTTHERIKALEEALETYGNHDSKCLLSQYREGRPTEGRGYETLYGYGDKAKWYRGGERPECTCGFDAALAGGKE